jgi:cytochrome c oxidase subunit 4
VEIREAEDVVRTAGETEPEAAAGEPELAAHPGPREYVIVSVVLAIATLVEVGLFYIPRSWGIPRGVIIGLLLFFMAAKFALVVLWFMHLRFDSPLFRRLFVTGLLLAIAVYLIVLLSFRTLEFGEVVLAFVIGVAAIAVLSGMRRVMARWA